MPMFQVIKNVSIEDLEEHLNKAAAEGFEVFQVLPTITFETKTVALMKVCLPNAVLFNIILKKA